LALYPSLKAKPHKSQNRLVLEGSLLNDSKGFRIGLMYTENAENDIWIY